MDEYDKNLESLKLRKDNLMEERKGFLKYSTYTIIVLILISISQVDETEKVKLFFLGNLEIPQSIIIKQILIIRSFLSILLLTSFIGWIISIIDINKHPMYNLYRGEKSFVAKINDWWDKLIKVKWLSMISILDFLQKLLFLSMVTLIIIALWIL